MRDKGLNVSGMEIDYRAGILSNREIGGKYGCSHSYVVKLARERGWERDLTPRIKQRSDAIVAKTIARESAKANKPTKTTRKKRTGHDVLQEMLDDEMASAKGGREPRNHRIGEGDQGGW